MLDAGAVMPMSENASVLVEKRNFLLWSCDIAGVLVVKIEFAAVVVMSETGAVIGVMSETASVLVLK